MREFDFMSKMPEIIDKVINNSATIALGESAKVFELVDIFISKIPEMELEEIRLQAAELKVKIDEVNSQYISTFDRAKDMIKDPNNFNFNGLVPQDFDLPK